MRRERGVKVLVSAEEEEERPQSHFSVGGKTVVVVLFVCVRDERTWKKARESRERGSRSILIQMGHGNSKADW